MTVGAEALKDAHAKLDWATSRHEEMSDRFAKFALPGEGGDRPYGIELRQLPKPRGLVVVSFTIDKPMPPEMSMLAADLIHNTRVALDHVLARLKHFFGGDERQGVFPVCKTEDEWERRVANAGSKNPLHGLDQAAVDLIYDEQPCHRDHPGADPLVIANQLDNDDKHRLLHVAFVIVAVEKGLDLIQILDPRRVRQATNLWKPGQPLEHRTKIARFLVDGDPDQLLRVHDRVSLGYATGELGAPEIGYMDMVDRVRGIAQKAAQLIDQR